MPQLVEVPGHGTVEFPDYMSDDEIAAAIRRNIMTDKPNELQSAIAGASQGVNLGFGDEMMAGLMAPVEYGVSRFMDVPGMSEKSLPDIYAAERDKIRLANKLAEETNPKSYFGGMVASGLATPAGPLSQAKTAADLAKVGGAFGAGAGLGFSDAPLLSVDALKDTAIGGVAGATLTPALSKGLPYLASPIESVRKGIGKILNIDPEKVAAFKAANIAPTVGDVSSSPVVQRGQNILSDIPFSSGPINKGEERVKEGVTSGLKSAGYDESLEQIVGGNAAKQGLENYVSRGKKLFGKAYDDFDAKYIASDEITPAKNLFSKINDMESRADTKEALDVMLSPQEKEFINKVKSAALTKNPIRNAESPYLVGEISKEPELTWRDFKTFRTSIGKKLSDYTIGSSEKSGLRELYQAMTSDLRAKASEKGPEALKSFDKLNSQYEKFQINLDNNINPLLNKPEVSEILTSINKGLKLPEKTASVMRALPQDQRNVVRGSLIREMGMKRTQQGVGFDPVKFSMEYKKLDPAAKKAFTTGMDSTTRNRLDAITDAAELAKKTSLQDNPSGSGKHILLGSGVVSSLYQAPLTTTALLGAGRVTAQMMQSPKFIEWVSRAPKKMGKDPAKYVAALGAIAATDEAVADDIEEYQRNLEQQIGVEQKPKKFKNGGKVDSDYTPMKHSSDLYKFMAIA